VRDLVYLLPYPPSLNHLYPTVRGRRMLSVTGRKFKEAVVVAVLSQGRPAKPLTGRLWYVFRVYPPDRRVRDLSNVVKILEDSLTAAGVWEDDGQVDDQHVLRMPPTQDGAVEVTVGRLPC